MRNNLDSYLEEKNQTADLCPCLKKPNKGLRISRIMRINVIMKTKQT